MANSVEANSVEANSTERFSGVVRWLLCGGSLPAHPSIKLVESKNSKEVEKPENTLKSDEAKLKAAETPGVVARLMGLDSLPEDIKPKSKSLSSYFRSRSLNSIDFLAQFDVSCKQSPPQHRRVRTSVSFREVPSLDLKGKHDFDLILHFEQIENCKATTKYQERSEAKQKKVLENESNQSIKDQQYLMKKSCKKLEDKPKKVRAKLSSEVGYSTTPRKKNVSRKTNVDLKERRPAKSQYSKKQNNKNSQCNPKNSLSFSVFDEIQHYQMHPVATPSASEVLPVLQCSNKPIPHSKNGELKAITDEHYHNKTMEEESYYNIKLVEKVRNLTENDLKESCWVPSQVLKFEDFEEICVHHGQQIFELLLNQVIDELVQLHRRKGFFPMHVKERNRDLQMRKLCK